MHIGQYVHICYMTQALYCRIVASADLVMTYSDSETVIFSNVHNIECSGPVV